MGQKQAVESLVKQGFVRCGQDDGAVVVRRGADIRIVRRDGGVRRCDRQK